MDLEYKRASWLELFYDVAFVALVAQLTYLIYEHHSSLKDLLHTFIVGYAIFITWWATTANRNLQPTEGTGDKLYIQLQMVGAFFLSITMPAVFREDYGIFFMTLGILRMLQGGMLLRMYYKYPSTRPVTYNIVEGIFAGALLWFLAAFFVDPWHYIIVFAALAVDILTPLTRGKGNTKRYLNVFHLQERLGLFLMLVIGESMIVVALANTAAQFRATEPLVILSGLLLMISFWWLYFEHSDEHAGVRPKDLFLFLHAHGFLFGSIILLSVGYKLVMSSKVDAGLLFVFAGAAGMAITLGVIRSTLYTLHGRELIIGTILLVLFAVVIYVGIILRFTLTAIVGTAVLFAVVAILDRKGIFKKLDKKLST